MIPYYSRASWTRVSARVLTLSAAALVLPRLACAQTSPFQTGADNLVTSLTTLATPIAILAVMALAVVAMTGRISWGWPIGALVGIGVIFGAPQMVGWIQGLFA